MELDDMKAAWKMLDQRLNAQAELNLHMFKEGKLDRLRRGLRPLVWGQAIQIVIGTLVALWGGGFWGEHLDVPHLLIPGLCVHAAGISMIALGVWMEVLIARIDYSAPVLTMQRQLAQLRKVFVFGGLAVGLPWWLLWIPFLMVACGYAGVDLYLNAPSVIYLGTAIGVAGLLGTWIFLRWAGTRPQLARRLEDNAAGRGINRAQAYMDEIAHFEKE
jgi:hypothetical protein